MTLKKIKQPITVTLKGEKSIYTPAETNTDDTAGSETAEEAE